MTKHSTNVWTYHSSDNLKGWEGIYGNWKRTEKCMYVYVYIIYITKHTIYREIELELYIYYIEIYHSHQSYINLLRI